MFGYIYLTTNIINNKKYIGQHKSDKNDKYYLGSGIVLREAINKYGKENFKVTILEWCNSQNELNDREIYWINYYNAVNDDNFYNIAEGGRGHLCSQSQKDAFEKGRHLPASDKLKKKLSEIRKGCIVSKETRKLLSDAQKKHRFVNDGYKNIVVDVNELDKYLKQGYNRGMLKGEKLKQKGSTTKGSCPVGIK